MPSKARTIRSAPQVRLLLTCALALTAFSSALGQPLCPVADPLCTGLATTCVSTVPGTQCRSQTIVVDSSGILVAQSCACFADTECGAIFYDNLNDGVRCVGNCPVPPAGNECQVLINGVPSGLAFVTGASAFPPGTTFQCGCVTPPPPTCGPDATGTACNQTTCPNGVDACLPKCIRVTATGQQIIESCECMPSSQCHAAFGSPAPNPPTCVGTCPPGFVCNQTTTTNADGSITYCCECIQAPPNCPLGDPLCQNLISGCVNPTPGSACRAQMIIRMPGVPNGIFVENCACLNDTDCGAITYLPALDAVSCLGNCPVPPQGNQCEVFINGMPSGQSTVVVTPFPAGTTFSCACAPTPPPCTPDATGTACNPTQCPNPGEVCLPRCIKVTGNGQQIVVDCQCIPDTQCHIIPGPVGTNEPVCVGVCPAGFTCQRTSTFDPADGSTTYCCECVQTPPNCPIGDPICNNLISGCLNPTPGSTCRAQMIFISPNGPIAENCACFNDTDCGAIQYFPTANVVRCVGNCPIPPQDNKCNVFINGVASGLSTVNLAGYPVGTTFTCGCAPPPPPPACEPNATGTACNPSTCPIPGQVCLPRCIRVDGNGIQTVVDCECMPDTQCHIIPGPAGTLEPICVGVCPPGYTCERSATFNPADGSTTYCCSCRPDPIHCEPLPDQSACPQTICPTPGDTCKPKCIEVDGQGLVRVVNCECGSPDACHAEMGPAGPICAGVCPPGYTCVQQVYTTPTGTTYCCECVQSPPNCPIGDPICNNLISGCLNPTPGSTCRAQMIFITPNGPIAENCACFNDTDCGAIQYFPTANVVRCVGNCPTTPPNLKCNVFINGVASGLNTVNLAGYPIGTTFTCGCAPPPPAPCTPNATGTGCNPTTCPVPGQVCLPRCIRVDANGHQTVVDCECMPDTQCHIIPAPAGALQPICVGVCPPGYTCERTAKFEPADGSTTYCCSCRPDPIHCEPLPDQSACPQTICPIPGETCKPKCIEMGDDGQIRVINCECGNPDTCHAEMGPAGPICVGVCPPGFTCVQHIYPTPTGIAYCCDCRPDPEFCEPTADGQDCTQYICPPGSTGVVETCRPKCVTYNPATGQYIVRKCECVGDPSCYVDLSGPAPTVPHCAGNCPPGTYCVENRIQNADGTISICCDCRPITCDCPGDINGDGVLNGLDIAGFVRCWLGTSLPGDNCACADIDGDGIYTQVDINQFITRILTKAQCSPTPCCPKANLSLDLTTGRDDNGNVIPVNTDDDNWVVTLDPISSTTEPRPATVVTPHTSWATFPNSQWISADYFGPNGDYEYRFCFCLDDRFKNPLLTLRLRTDDDGQVFLNGNFIGNAAPFSDPNPPVISTNNAAFFQPGENCVIVRVQNIGGAPTGLNMVGSVTAQDGKCCCPPARLTKDIKSGVYDVNGPLIPFGQDDDTWTVTCDATGGTVPRPAKTIVPHSAWATIPGTRWISATTSATNGLYCYQYCFCLDPRFKNATLSLSLLADDAATVWLNGVQIGATPNGWAFLNPPTQIFVSNQSLFRPCENCIEIRVVNSGGVITGMDVAGTITADDGLCCDDRQYSCCAPGGDCFDLAPGTTQCPPNMFPPGITVPGPCGNYTACCMPNGTCQMMSPKCCTIAGGTSSPAGTACSTAAPQACCLSTTGCQPCVIVDPACCVSIYNGIPQGPGSFCPPPPP